MVPKIKCLAQLKGGKYESRDELMKVSQQDLEMADDVYGAMLTEVPSLHRLTIWAMAALLFCFLVWSYFAALYSR